MCVFISRFFAYTLTEVSKPAKSDLEVYGSGAPMNGRLGFDARNTSESESISRHLRNMAVSNRSKVPDRVNTPARSVGRQASRVQLGMILLRSESI